MSTFVRSVTAAGRLDGSRLKSASLMSAKQAVAPASRMEFKVATNVKGLVTTSSPGCSCSASSATTRAVVPLLTATACAAPVISRQCSSKRCTIAPCASMPERSTCSTRSSSSGPTLTTVIGIMTGRRCNVGK